MYCAPQPCLWLALLFAIACMPTHAIAAEADAGNTAAASAVKPSEPVKAEEKSTANLLPADTLLYISLAAPGKGGESAVEKMLAAPELQPFRESVIRNLQILNMAAAMKLGFQPAEMWQKRGGRWDIALLGLDAHKKPQMAAVLRLGAASAAVGKAISNIDNMCRAAGGKDKKSPPLKLGDKSIPVHAFAINGMTLEFCLEGESLYLGLGTKESCLPGRIGGEGALADSPNFRRALATLAKGEEENTSYLFCRYRMLRTALTGIDQPGSEFAFACAFPQGDGYMHRRIESFLPNDIFESMAKCSLKQAECLPASTSFFLTTSIPKDTGAAWHSLRDFLNQNIKAAASAGDQANSTAQASGNQAKAETIKQFLDIADNMEGTLGVSCPEMLGAFSGEASFASGRGGVFLMADIKDQAKFDACLEKLGKKLGPDKLRSLPYKATLPGAAASTQAAAQYTIHYLNKLAKPLPLAPSCVVIDGKLAVFAPYPHMLKNLLLDLANPKRASLAQDEDFRQAASRVAPGLCLAYARIGKDSLKLADLSKALLQALNSTPMCTIDAGTLPPELPGSVGLPGVAVSGRLDNGLFIWETQSQLGIFGWAVMLGGIITESIDSPAAALAEIGIACKWRSERLRLPDQAKDTFNQVGDRGGPGDAPNSGNAGLGSGSDESVGDDDDSGGDDGDDDDSDDDDKGGGNKNEDKDAEPAEEPEPPIA